MAHSYTQARPGTAGIHFSHIKLKITGFTIRLLYTLFPGFMGKILLKQFFAPKRHVLDREQMDYLSTGTPFDLKVNRDTIKCWQWGQGPALIFVHGWGGIGLQFHKYIDKALALGFSVIIFDAPAHGLSPGETCSYFQMTDAVRTLINRKNSSGVAGLIGHSFGAAAVINAISKENLSLPAVLIAPALNLVNTLDRAFSSYGIPKGIYMDLIKNFEQEYGYSFYHDNPVNLLDGESQNLFMVHDPQDQVIPYGDSRHAGLRYPSFKLMTVKDLGHKRIVGDRAVVSAALNYIESQAGSGQGNS